MNERLAPPSYQEYVQYRDALAVSQARAEAIVAEAQPHAKALLAHADHHVTAQGLLPVRPHVIPARQGRYGYLLPAWPEPEKRPVPLYVVPTFGLLGYLWRRSIGEPGPWSAAVTERFLSGERVWVGLANDVLQPFVPNPPPGSYRMYRHHALMLFCATTWLPAEQRDGWLALYHFGAQQAVRRYALGASGDPVAWLDEADQRASTFYETYGAGVHDDDTVRAFLDDPWAVDRYSLFFGLSSIGIAVLARAHEQCAELERRAWLFRMVNQEHSDPRFLVDAVRRYVQAVP